MGLVLKNDSAMLKEIEKIPVQYFPYVFIKSRQRANIKKL